MADTGRNLTFRVHIHEGIDFGTDLQALVCHVTLGDSTRHTAYSVQRDRHTFDSIVQWTLSKQQWRKLSSTGQFFCKVTVYKKSKEELVSSKSPDKDLARLGWVVLDLRQAKLNRQYNKDQGEWYTLSGYKPGTAAAPKLRVAFHIEEELTRDTVEAEQQLMSRIDQRLTPPARQTKPRPSEQQDVQDQDKTAEPSLVSGALGSEISQTSYTSSSNPSSHASQQPLPPAPNSPGPAMPTFQNIQALDQLHAAGGEVQHAGSSTVQAEEQQGGAQGPQVVVPTQDDDGPFKSFTLTLDVRSFHASIIVPFPTCNVYIQARLPADVQGVISMYGGGSATRLSPLVSRPAVAVAAGNEQPIPNGVGSADFVCGVLRLARVLALESRATLEVWHRPITTPDVLLGVATVPLSPLLHDCWVDGLAPVYAQQQPNGEPHASLTDRIQVGTLRVVLSLQDGPPPPGFGDTPHVSHVSATQLTQPLPPVAPAPPPPAAHHVSVQQPTPVIATVTPAAPHRSQPTHTASPTQSQPHAARQQAGTQPGSASEAGKPGSVSQHDGIGLRGRKGHAGQQVRTGQPLPQHPAMQRPHSPPATTSPPPPQRSPQAVQRPPASPYRAPPPVAASMPSLASLQQLPEYEVAYQLEVCKKAEEAKWRAELKERESARMVLMEAEWRRRERARETELASMRSEYAGLEAKTRQMLSDLEQRERRLVSAEEAVASRRREMEREHSSRMAEAEAAVRRLQVECEHQLEIERDRNAELGRLRLASEERLAVSEARCVAVEQAFAAYRDEVRNTNEAQLSRELLETRDQLARAEDRASRAQRAKAAYKQQVVKLAEQLAALHRDVQRWEALQGAAQHKSVLAGPVDVPALQQAAEQQARFASAHLEELAQMRQQLATLKAAALSSPTSAAPTPHRPPQDMQQQQQEQPTARQPVASPAPAPGQPPPQPAPVPGLTVPQPAPALPQPSPSAPFHPPQQMLLQPLPANQPVTSQPAVSQPEHQQISDDLTPTKSRPSFGGEAPTVVPAPPPVSSQTPPAQPLMPFSAAGAAVQDVQGPPLPSASPSAGTGGQGWPQTNLKEVQRLLRRKSELLATGAYAPDDPLIQRIDAKVSQLAGLTQE